MDRTILSLDARDRRAAMMDNRLGAAAVVAEGRNAEAATRREDAQFCW